jgi:thiamine kinase-like enzyme
VADLTGIVEWLEPRLGPISGPPLPLEGGITNRNYKARLGGRDYVIRLPGKDTELLGISRDAERIANAAAAGLGIAPAVAAGNDDCLVNEFLDCTDVDPDQLRADPGDVARALRAFHDSGTELPARFWVPELLDDYAGIVAERGGTLPPEYEATRSIAARVADALPLSAPAACHDDLLPANLLRVNLGDGQRTLLVDWEYAGMGHPLFDLGNLAVNNEFDEAAEERLLGGYFGAPVTDGRRAALKLMKIMSDAREAAWGVVQGVISELEFDFAGYAQKHFDRLAAAAEDPRLGEWLDSASA